VRIQAQSRRCLRKGSRTRSVRVMEPDQARRGRTKRATSPRPSRPGVVISRRAEVARSREELQADYVAELRRHSVANEPREIGPFVDGAEVKPPGEELNPCGLSGREGAAL